ncbi:sensor histidine kinase [Phenylobacterium sp.]|jgi:two-component sensor histidine kinase|uniref:sensor histidine kinase n=1 Tax=Phenylobacterium sp. TaxID=1871053 RepID=UPI002E325203|nr:HWE histidine kinase domain-containing protein [Phenylobacterium sp.]HEX2562011.1 HWE histidine kinase domain-containing protein [Phenylobacterium sp.]
MFDSPFPICLWIGPEYALLYNDAYRRILSAKHPASLGQPGGIVWAEIWEELQPQFDQVRRGGDPIFFEDAPFTMARLEGGASDLAWFSYSLSALRAEDGSIPAVLNISPETTPRVLAERQVSFERDRLSQMFAQAPTFMALLSGPEHRVDLANGGYMQLVGHRPVLGRTVAEALPDAVEQGYLTLLDEVFATGRPYLASGAKYTVQAQPGGPVNERYVDFVYQPLKDAAGQVTGIFVQGADVTDRQRQELELRNSEEKLKLMVLELNHRVKNNLATVQAIAVQTLSGDRPAAQMRESFLQRISALATAHDILTQEQWEGATLHSIAKRVLSALAAASDRVHVAGPDASLSSKCALALSMAFHELGTNALKYGALGAGGGYVTLSSAVEPGGRLKLEWRERGGPAVQPPSRRGFGSRLLERGLAAELNGSVELMFEQAGLRCLIAASLDC